jgi:hypothetical protein
VGEGVAEVHEGSDKDEDVEDEGSHIAERHCEGRREENIMCGTVQRVCSGSGVSVSLYGRAGIWDDYCAECRSVIVKLVMGFR